MLNEQFDQFKSLFSLEELKTIPNIYDYRNSAKRLIEFFNLPVKEYTVEKETLATRDCIINVSFLYQITIVDAIKIHMRMVDWADGRYEGKTKHQTVINRPQTKKPPEKPLEKHPKYYTEEQLKEYKQFLDNIYKNY